MINLYWDERNGLLYKESVIKGKIKSIFGSKPVNAEIIELNCIGIDGKYYQMTPYKGPIKRLGLITEEVR